MAQTSTDAQTRAAIALTRFGLGARPGDIESVAGDPQGWLIAQIRPIGAPMPADGLPTTRNRLSAWQTFQTSQRERRRDRADAAETTGAPDQMASASTTAADRPPASADAGANAEARFDATMTARRELRQQSDQEFLMRTRHGSTTSAGFAERWALFWANTLSVSATKFPSAVFMGPYEREAIRPNVFGPFEDLLVAAETHPAMLVYLDQAQSVGPNSRNGQQTGAGLNENLAREIMELHTLGADAGFTQSDVTELARALTGWAMPRAREGETEKVFNFYPRLHEPGPRTILGKTYAEGGLDQGQAILRDLANHPATARRAAKRIASHFVSDTPSPALVDALERAWIDSGGDLAVVARVLVQTPESWAAEPAKFKTPYEFVVSTHRALGTSPQAVQGLQIPLVEMGQPAFSAPSPEGWPDTAADWAGPDAIVKRFEWAKVVGTRSAQKDPVATAEAALGARMGERTRQTVARAESRAEGLTLFLMSPEFQRR